jgi:hypothetical protein
VLRVLRLGLPLRAEAADALVEALLFLAIVGFSWPTRGGRQCWNSEFQQAGKVAPHSVGAPSRGQDAEKDKVARVSLLYTTNL